MTDKLIYLASPYTNPDRDVMERRFQIVCRVAGRLMREGNLIFSPIAHTHSIAVVAELPRGWDFWKRYDETMLCACSEIWVLRLEGWNDSVGIKQEIQWSEREGKLVKFIDPINSDLT